MISLLSGFDAIYIINLPARADRRVEMDAQLRHIGLGLEHAGVVLFPAVRPAAADGFPSVGAHGCFMSHLGVLRHALEAGQSRILILEDDVDFVRDFGDRWPATARALAARAWSVFYGGYESAGTVRDEGDGVCRIAPEQGVRTTHFIAFQGPAIGEAVAYLEAILKRPPGDPAGGPMHVDGAYSRLRADHPAWLTLVAVPELGHQRASRTDIHALRWFDRIPVVRTLAALARKARNLATA